MATFSQKAGTALFGFFLVLAIIGDYICCVILSGLHHIGLLSASFSEGLALMCTKATWSLAVHSAFWIQTSSCEVVTPGAWDLFIADLDEAEAAVAAGGERKNPVFILSNHVSFMDTLLIVVYTPAKVLWRIRCYMGAHLFKLPLFSTICKVLGHFPVYFLKDEDGKFGLDKERMVAVEEKVGQHLSNGGVLSLFPEGIMNRAADPKDLNTFRHGTFKRALLEDAKIWHFVMYGHHKVWPVKAAIGGMPAKTGLALHPLSRKGAKATLADLTKGDANFKSCETGSTEDFVILAEYAKVQMQKEYDALAAFVENGNKSKGKKTD